MVSFRKFIVWEIAKINIKLVTSTHKNTLLSFYSGAVTPCMERIARFKQPNNRRWADE